MRNVAKARPTGFLRPNSKWSRLLRTQPDHRLWETAVLFHLRDAFRAGDLWLARSRRYGDIRKTLLSAPAVVDADRSLPVPATPQGLARGAQGRAGRGAAQAGRRGASRRDHGRQHRRWHAPHRKDRRNTQKLSEAVFARQKAELETPAEFLTHVSPLGWEHINLTGEYRWPGAGPHPT
ncbi:MAG: Tn3 family transposase [Acidobacteria bacterium]|nr:Tn3 family transposase [Acidobacteriota bacterium]